MRGAWLVLALAGAAAAAAGEVEVPNTVIEDLNRDPPAPSPAAGGPGGALGVGSPGRRGPRTADPGRGAPSGTVLELSTTTHRVEPHRPHLRRLDQSR